MPKKCQSIARKSFSVDCPKLHKDANASPQLIQARALLRMMPLIDKERWEKGIQKLRRSNQIEGPRAVSWMFSSMARILPPGEDRRKTLETADTLMEEAVVMRKIQKGWKKYWENPLEPIFEKPERILPRYHSAESFFLPNHK